MMIEEQTLEQLGPNSSLKDLTKDAPTLNEEERNTSLASIEDTRTCDVEEQQRHEETRTTLARVIEPAVVAYGLKKLSEMPVVRDVISNCKASVSESLSDIGKKIGDFFGGLYQDIKGFVLHNDSDAKAIERMGDSFVEQRDFGLDKCTEAAKAIFNPGVIENWSNLSMEQRKEIAGAYAAEVSSAFELQSFTGVYFEDLEPGVLGYNNGDGSIHLSNEIIKPWTSPLEIMNTITHELRHQYQFEAVHGYHNVAEDVVKEWATAYEIYNYDQPYCYDPWGYTYNPLEIDARYAGETVVRNVTHDMINA